jgi:hypothetical protein
MNIQPGDIVLFGRPYGQKTKGKVLRVAGKSALVQISESRGRYRTHGEGTKYRVPLDSRFIQVIGHEGHRQESSHARTTQRGVGHSQLESLIDEFLSEIEQDVEEQIYMYSRPAISKREWQKIKNRLSKESSKVKIRDFLFAISEGNGADKSFSIARINHN